MDEGLVAGEKAVAAGEQIAFEPTLAHVFAEHFHHAAIGCDVIVIRQDLGCGFAIGDFEQSVQAIGTGFVGAHHAEIAWPRR